jgi:hypothetical protein
MHVPQHQTAPHFMGPQLVVLLHWFNVCCPIKIRCIYPPFLILTRVSRTGHETSTGTSYCAAIVASNLVNALLYPYRTSVGLLLWRLLLQRDPAGRRTLPGGSVIEMDLYTSLLLVFLLFPLQTWSQTVQDDWTAPAAPDGSTPLQTGTKFTLLWKSGLQNSFETYCPECDTKKLDLWITNFNGTKYTSKIGRE